MGLVLEDGTLVAGANSFASVAEARTFASDRGVALDADDDVVDILLIKAGDYINSLENRFLGKRMNWDQAMVWPRQEVVIDGIDISTTLIPEFVKRAQIIAAIEAQTKVLLPAGDSRLIKKEQVDVLVTEYFEGDPGSGALPSLPAVLAELRPLLRSSGGAGTLSSAYCL